MGFDPRDWSATSHDIPTGKARGERVTSNVEALLRENDSLRREVHRLELELDRCRRRQWQRPRREPFSRESWQQSSTQSPPRVTATQVQRWGASLADQRGWTELRATGLVALIDQLNRDSFHAQLTLQQRLDRLVTANVPWPFWLRLPCMAFERVNGWMKILPGLWGPAPTPTT